MWDFMTASVPVSVLSEHSLSSEDPTDPAEQQEILLPGKQAWHPCRLVPPAATRLRCCSQSLAVLTDSESDNAALS